MPRPERIEYENAYYHVMNRGKDRGRIKIFRSPEYFEAFLRTLKEAAERFGIVIHGYCLMTNHYHLLIQTPHANLSRAMRHINGVYTQRYNQLAKSDGPIFRGRFKSILVDQDVYLLQLSRYIHLNPIEGKKPLVDNLADYPWSSFPAYINQADKPAWLMCDEIYGLLGSKQKYSEYARYVAQGNNEQLTRFYNRGNTASVIGEKEFVKWLSENKIPKLKENKKANLIIPFGLSIEQIVKNTAAYYQKPVTLLRQLKKGRNSQSTERKIAIYLCQHLGDHRLNAIADYFGLGHSGSVSHITCLVRNQLSKDIELTNEVAEVCKFIVNQVT
ncbi:conserved hypothetical protein [Candidatus Nitrotoga sp. BS]|uniref:transposase n=1 Tax=Candidatus Nitrotoga sp. BS TaxID=2890408 RepID=UPI001EF31630|nr:transposase [Candidatus Nitrotoga sp. BS]CAH1204085.1 conserved hypothetical protein [Candidatus Nitrotoga sp. BS]